MIRNNHGWGLKEMLFLTALLLFFLLVIAVLVNNLYSGLEKNNQTTTPKNNYTYKQVEENLKEASQKYIKKIKEEKELVSSEELLKENIIELEKLTSGNDICEGYVKIENKVYTPYISCVHYKTEGY